MEAPVIEREIPQRNVQRNDMLKLLAIVTMLIDHIGYMFFPNELLFRIIGRLAFPIFAYQIAVGYSHTSNLKKYTLRLFIFAVVAQLPYSFFSPEIKFSPIHYNVLFTFVLAIGLLFVYDKGILVIGTSIKHRRYARLLYGILLMALAVIIIILREVISFIVKGFYMEYGLLALAMILLFHIFQDRKGFAIASIVLLYLLHGYYRVALFNSAYSSELFWSNLINVKYIWSQLDLREGLAQMQRYYFNAWGILALLPIFWLESVNTNWIRLNKYVGYVFYPAHMALLIVIAAILRAF